MFPASAFPNSFPPLSNCGGLLFRMSGRWIESVCESAARGQVTGGHVWFQSGSCLCPFALRDQPLDGGQHLFGIVRRHSLIRFPQTCFVCSQQSKDGGRTEDPKLANNGQLVLMGDGMSDDQQIVFAALALLNRQREPGSGDHLVSARFQQQLTRAQ